MNDIQSLIRRLVSRGVGLENRGGRIRVNAPKGVLQQSDLEEMRRFKSAILQLLAERMKSSPPLAEPLKPPAQDLIPEAIQTAPETVRKNRILAQWPKERRLEFAGRVGELSHGRDLHQVSMKVFHEMEQEWNSAPDSR